MRLIVNQPPRGQIDVSVVLLDWSCRESLHVLDYLADQTADRWSYEIIWVEYYDEPCEPLLKRIESARGTQEPPPVDICAVLDMDRSLYHHKHLMFNAGLVLANGRIVCFADSDAIVRRTFIESIVGAFERTPGIVLHLDEARNNHPSYYPFRYPSIDDVTGFGCINWVNGTTAGLLDKADPLHSRNYGACMAALHRDLIEIGGADMHIDYLGHICGPYEMTFRLANAGRREVWHDSEWLYHVWHPGQAGTDNYCGPDDGMQMSARALACRHSGSVMPSVENPAVQMLRTGQGNRGDPELLDALVAPQYGRNWCRDALDAASRSPVRRKSPGPLFGRSIGLGARLRMLLLGGPLVWRQLKVKRRAAARSGPYPDASPPARWLRKLRALASFLGRILAFDKYWFRQCWLALAYAAQEEKDRLVLCGQGEAARILCALSAYLPVTITHICPVQHEGAKRMFGRQIISWEELAEMDATVLAATFVDVPAYLDRLKELGIGRDRIITLQ